MSNYFIAVFGIVVLTSVLLMYILNKVHMLDFRLILAVSLSSILAGLMFPAIFSMFASGRGGSPDIAQLTFTMAATLVLYIMLVLILSVIITMVVPSKAFAVSTLGVKKDKGNNEMGTVMAESIEQAANMDPVRETNYLEEIYGKLVDENVNTSSNIDVAEQKAENNLEKSVDSEENIDKMGLETFNRDLSLSDDNLLQNEANLVIDTVCEVMEDTGAMEAVNMSLEECVEEAFRLKVQGDSEGAILYFMYALDRKPDKDLTFWVVLDICVLYKSIGQVDFAGNMLSTYFDTYSDIMDSGVREEIEKNLFNMDEGSVRSE